MILLNIDNNLLIFCKGFLLKADPDSILDFGVLVHDIVATLGEWEQETLLLFPGVV